jgi:hypothetical protein
LESYVKSNPISKDGGVTWWWRSTQPGLIAKGIQQVCHGAAASTNADSEYHAGAYDQVGNAVISLASASPLMRDGLLGSDFRNWERWSSPTWANLYGNRTLPTAAAFRERAGWSVNTNTPFYLDGGRSGEMAMVMAPVLWEARGFSLSGKISPASKVAGAAGGEWAVLDEVAGGAVRQLTPNACGPTCGQMLLGDRGLRVFQSNLASQSGKVLSSPMGMELSMNAIQVGWRGGYVGPDAFRLLNRGGSWGAMMRGGGSVDHWVVVDGLDDLGRVIIRDPFQGSSYRMLQSEFQSFWNGNALWGPKP